MTPSREILCVVSESQRREYRVEFDLLHRAGVGLIFESCPGQALALLENNSASLVIVGLEIGWARGREFLADLARRHPHFNISVVLLPNKEDPLPSLVYSRDPSSGRVAAKEIAFDRFVVSLVESTARTS